MRLPGIRLSYRWSCFRHWLGLKLLRRESEDVRTALWEIMSCGTGLTPETIELSVATGHNQTIKINNGARLFYIHLHHNQASVEFIGRIPDPAKPEDPDAYEYEIFGGMHRMFPHDPIDMRSAWEALQEEKRKKS